jgi:hypothetical protein
MHWCLTRWYPAAVGLARPAPGEPASPDAREALASLRPNDGGLRV